MLKTFFIVISVVAAVLLALTKLIEEVRKKEKKFSDYLKIILLAITFFGATIAGGINTLRTTVVEAQDFLEKDIKYMNGTSGNMMLTTAYDIETPISL